jgi:hypothetical protein
MNRQGRQARQEDQKAETRRTQRTRRKNKEIPITNLQSPITAFRTAKAPRRQEIQAKQKRRHAGPEEKAKQ